MIQSIGANALSTTKLVNWNSLSVIYDLVGIEIFVNTSGKSMNGFRFP